MAEIKHTHDQFKSKFGLLCTSLGMAVGTGNIWRFPREVAANNGGAFILLTMVAIFFWAIPLIMAETVLGKKTRMANAGGFKALLGDKYTCLGAFAGMVCVMLGSYYAVVIGWCMKYLWLIFTGFLGQVQTQGVELTTQVWNDFAMKVPATEAMFWFWAALIIAGAIIVRGVQNGFEIANKIMLPSIFIVLAILFVRVIMLPNASKGLEFMFHVEPKDFLNPKIWLAAFTQAAWSTGAGWGMFHVFYVYSAKEEDIELHAFTAAMGDTVAALLAGMVVLPTVFALSKDPMAVMGSGANGLTFINLTNLFAHTPGGFILGALFFLTLLGAAVSTSLAMLELATRNLMDMGFSRLKGVVYSALFFALIGSWSALDNSIFENQDFTWGVALLVVGLIYWFAATKYGVEKLWEENIMDCSDIKYKWMWSGIKFFPVWFILVWGCWVYQAASWYPGEWFKFWPIQKYPYTPGIMVVEWGLMFLILRLLNNTMAKRLIHGNRIE